MPFPLLSYDCLHGAECAGRQQQERVVCGCSSSSRSLSVFAAAWCKVCCKLSGPFFLTETCLCCFYVLFIIIILLWVIVCYETIESYPKGVTLVGCQSPSPRPFFWLAVTEGMRYPGWIWLVGREGRPAPVCSGSRKCHCQLASVERL